MLHIRREIGDAIGELAGLANLGSLYATQNRWEEAKRFAFEALAASRAIGRRSTEANALSNLGMASDALGDWVGALDCLHAALTIQQEDGDRNGGGRVAGQHR